MPIRNFKKNDFPQVAEIYNRSKLDELLAEEKSFELLPLEKDEKRLQNLLESNIYVYEEEQILAYGALFDSEIRALFVHPDARGKGIGKTLLEFLMNKAEGTISLFVAKSNAPAKKLYSFYGFETVEEFETSYNGVPVMANKMLRP